ncbi:DNA alkylation repair protein [Neobacillus drentensis]|uniref:DNA alkylation repair protein n=1 Tax=Neobacillus drentensis TaxID=220684 RepID=UPI0030000083
MPTKIEKVTNLFEAYRNEREAGPMTKYMKNHFPFLGIKSPIRKELEKVFFKETGILKEPFDQEFILELWEKDEREYQYMALTYIEKSLKKLQKGDLALMERLVLEKSWWDTVDAIAAKAVGKIAEKFPEIIEETIDDWAEHDNLWLRRTAILFQLKYKEITDEERLYRYISSNSDSKEFFIQKAIGWALREYSKTNPSSVKQFINENSLAPLSVREGSKYVD